jgi:hypothetical protein
VPCATGVCSGDSRGRGETSVVIDLKVLVKMTFSILSLDNVLVVYYEIEERS